MIDQQFQKALSSAALPKVRRIKRITLFATMLLGISLGVMATGHLTSINGLDNLSDEALGKLAAFAACSSGQLPAAEWDRAQRSVSLFDHIFGQSRIAMARYFLSVIDTRKCTGSQTARTQHYDRIQI